VVWRQGYCGGAWKRRSGEGYECYVHEGMCEGEVPMVGKRDGGSHVGGKRVSCQEERKKCKFGVSEYDYVVYCVYVE